MIENLLPINTAAYCTGSEKEYVSHKEELSSEIENYHYALKNGKLIDWNSEEICKKIYNEDIAFVTIQFALKACNSDRFHIILNNRQWEEKTYFELVFGND